MKIPEQVIEQINTRINITDIVSGYVTLEKSGSRLRACCPFHQEKTPSFYLTPEKNLFYCFGCQTGGTMFDFLMKIENLSFREAALLLAEKAGISVDQYKNSPDKGENDALKELYSRISGAFSYMLLEKKEGSHALEYLKKRGFDENTIHEFSLGYSPDDRYWLHGFLLKKHYSRDFLAKSGLFSSRYPEISLFSGRVIFPIKSSRGDVIAFGGRTLGDNTPKYINSPETAIYRKRDTLYGFDSAAKTIKESRTFYIVEGYMDVLAMHQAGIKNSVAPLGTAFTDNQARLLSRYADRAVMVFDGDSAGINATRKSILICEKAGLLSEVIEFSKDSDPADMLQKEGPGALQKKVKFSINSFKYLVKIAQIDNNGSSPEGKLSILTELFPFIDSISAETKKEVYLRELSDIINVDFISVMRDYNVHREKGQGGISGFSVTQGIGKSDKKSVAKNGISADLYLLIAVAVNFEYFETVRSSLSLDDFQDDRACELFIIFEDCYRNEVFTVDSVLQNISDPELRSLILEKISTEEFKNNQQELIADSVNRVKARSLNDKKKRIEKLLRKNDYSVNSEKELLEELMFINGELLKLKVRNNG